MEQAQTVVVDAAGNVVLYAPQMELKMVQPKGGTRRSTNGFDLLDDEDEVYAESFVPLDVFSGQECCSCAKYFGCFLTIPKMNSKLEVCVTDRRLLMWEAGRKVLPGLHSFWYWYISFCHWPLFLWTNKMDTYLDRRVIVNIQDVKAVELQAKKTTGSFGMMCCPSTVEQEQFELKLLLTKPVGVFHPGENWMYSKQCNVSYKFLEVTGCGSLDKAQELRRVLDTVVQRNLDSDTDMDKTLQRLMANAAKSGGLLGKIKQSSKEISLADEGMHGGTAATSKINSTILMGLRGSQLVFALISFAIMASLYSSQDFTEAGLTLPVGVLIFVGSAAWLGAFGSFSFNKVTSPSFLHLSFLYDLLFMALAFSAAAFATPWDENVDFSFYDSLKASAAFMYLTGFSLVFSAIYLKFFGNLKTSLSTAASSTTGLLAIRAGQLGMAVISLALIANVYEDPSAEPSEIPSVGDFLLAVGALILIGNLAWMAAIASVGSTVALRTAFCIYDFIFIILTFCSATLFTEVTDLYWYYRNIFGENEDELKASSAFMYLSGVLFLCGSAIVHP